MKSVDALRKLVKRDGLILEGEEFDKCLDAIEEEGRTRYGAGHNDGAALAFELTKIAYKGDDERYQFCRRVEVAANDRDDVTLFGVDYTPLPVDADGVPIHVGETVTCVLPFGGESKPFVVDRMELGRDGDGDVWSVALDRPTPCWEQPLLLRHHHAPTVEDVLREYALKCEEAGNSGPEVKRLATEYAARLMLAGEE